MNNTRTILLTCVALTAFAANSLLCRLALGQELIDAAIAAHEDAVMRYRETYREQQALHARLSA